MDLLNDEQIDQINDILVNQGVNYEGLRNDLLDHICCMIEDEMQEGLSFSTGLDKALEEFGLENFKLIQESTMYMLNKKLNKMKKFTSIIGLIASLLVIAGVVFKINHILGAGVLLVLGLSIVSLVVLPLLAYLNIVAKEDKQTLIVSSIGYLAGMFLCLGGLFKIMHWPMAMVIFWIGAALLLLVFMPMYSIRSFRLAENKLFALTKSMLVIAGIVLFLGLTSITG